MTLIECFTDAHIDNIAASLRLWPETVIMVGNEAVMRDPVKRYKDLLQKRGQRTEVVMCDIRGKDFREICAVFDRLIRKEKECVIDLTGGDESVIMAIGSVLAGLDGKQRNNIQVQKYDRVRKAVLDCMHDNREIPGKNICLTVAELIALHGGTLHPKACGLPADYGRKELDKVWEQVVEDPKGWNRAITVLNELESRADSKTQVYLPLESLSGGIFDFEEKEPIVRQWIDRFHRLGLLEDQSSRNALEYTYTSEILRYCTLKAGNALEMKTLLEGQAVLENGAPFFCDCQMSVSIDWDGVIHEPMKRIPETRNEIDVVLMQGTTPLFVSCKNGNIGEEELYKLHTVASRFGGPYAKKMLVATDLNQKSAASNRSFIQRAWDMDIFLVTDAAELSKDEWRKTFRQAMQ